MDVRCWIERTSSEDSRESQSMMEWCRSVDYRRGPCSIISPRIIINNNNNEYHHRTCEYHWIASLLDAVGEEHWESEYLWVLDVGLSVQLLESHERANR